MHCYLKYMKAISTLIICFFAPALFAQTISGKVSCDGKGIKDVVVTNGIHFAQTDHKGEYVIPVTDNTSFVYLSTPAGYLINGNIVCLYFINAYKLERQKDMTLN